MGSPRRLVVKMCFGDVCVVVVALLRHFFSYFLSPVQILAEACLAWSPLRSSIFFFSVRYHHRIREVWRRFGLCFSKKAAALLSWSIVAIGRRIYSR